MTLGDMRDPLRKSEVSGYSVVKEMADMNDSSNEDPEGGEGAAGRGGGREWGAGGLGARETDRSPPGVPRPQPFPTPKTLPKPQALDQEP
jgi:hypothetical protein